MELFHCFAGFAINCMCTEKPEFISNFPFYRSIRFYRFSLRAFKVISSVQNDPMRRQNQCRWNKKCENKSPHADCVIYIWYSSQYVLRTVVAVSLIYCHSFLFGWADLFFIKYSENGSRYMLKIVWTFTYSFAK